MGASNALGSLGSERGIPVATASLGDEDAEVRQAAVIALLRIGSPEASPALEGALNDENREVRMYASEALERLEKGRR